MAEHEQAPPRDNPEVAHESADVDVKAIAKFTVGLIAAAIVIHIALYWLLVYYDARESRGWEPNTLVERSREAPPEPRLQVSPQADLARMRAAEEKTLQGYGWVDREKNVVRIPIQRAMEIIAEKGLPVRRPPQQKSQPQKPEAR